MKLTVQSTARAASKPWSSDAVFYTSNKLQNHVGNYSDLYITRQSFPAASFSSGSSSVPQSL